MRPIPTPGNPRSTMVFEHVDGGLCLRYVARYVTGLHVQLAEVAEHAVAALAQVDHVDSS
jgi:hypothetical protein